MMNKEIIKINKNDKTYISITILHPSLHTSIPYVFLVYRYISLYLDKPYEYHNLMISKYLKEG